MKPIGSPIRLGAKRLIEHPLHTPTLEELGSPRNKHRHEYTDVRSFAVQGLHIGFTYNLNP